MLIRCQECDRHVREDEAQCPFCETRVDRQAERPKLVQSRGLSRREMIGLAAVATAVTGCPKKRQPDMPYGCVWPEGRPDDGTSPCPVTPDESVVEEQPVRV